MSKRSKLWLFSGVIYGAFVFWFTDFGGPLKDSETEGWIKPCSPMEPALDFANISR